MLPVLLSLLPLSGSNLVPAQEDLEKDATALLRWAIRAHGGADALRLLQVQRQTVRGVLHAAGTKSPFTGTVVTRLPNQFRNELQFETAGKKRELIQVFDGAKGWLREGGTTRTPETVILESWAELAHATHLATLFPLLAMDKGYESTPLGVVTHKGRKTFGLKIVQKGHREVRLYFDAESGLLHRLVYQPTDGGPETLREELYSNYKSFQGLKKPMTTTVSLGGVLHAQIDLLSLTFLDSVADRTFAKP